MLQGVSTMALREALRGFFKPPEGRRVVLVGIGSPIRHDDAAGLRVLELLGGRVPENVLLLRTEIVPESYTGAIRDFNPSHVLLLDAANFDGEPGEARIIPRDMIANATVSTHSLPLHIFIDYVRRSICERVALLGIQGADISLGEGMTPEVEKGALLVADAIKDSLA